MGIYLAKPNKNKTSEDGESKDLRYGMSSMQGWRMNMEDSHICQINLEKDIDLFAVFDGHGGHEVADFCAKYFSSCLKENENFKK